MSVGRPEPPRLIARKYAIQGCTIQCSFHPRNLRAGAADAIHRWIEQGLNNEQVLANGKQMGWNLSNRALYRHKRNHLVPKEQMTQFGNEPVILDNDDEDPDEPKKLSDLEILDKIIAAGSKQMNSQSVRITPDLTMRAMELRLKLTQGSVFDDFLSAVGSAFGPDDAPTGQEAPEEKAAPAEQAQKSVE